MTSHQQLLLAHQERQFQQLEPMECSEGGTGVPCRTGRVQTLQEEILCMLTFHAREQHLSSYMLVHGSRGRPA